MTSALADTRRTGAAHRRVRLTSWAIDAPGCTVAEHARELLGRKGLLYKEPATLLALCAVHRALGLSPHEPRGCADPDPRTAVVVSSNLGNVETVTKIARTVDAASLRAVSVMDAPNASSNVIASTIAIWFRLGGPNLMTCSGTTSGLDAMWLAALLLRSGRAKRAVVVGVEPDDAVSLALRRPREEGCAPVRACAACVILERLDGGAGERPVLGPIGFVPERGQLTVGSDDELLVGPLELGSSDHSTIDVELELGDLYGALGVVQVAAAAALIADAANRSHKRATVVCGDDLDGWRTVTIFQPHHRGPKQ